MRLKEKGGNLEELLDNNTEAVGHGHVKWAKVGRKPLVQQRIINAKVPHLLGILKSVLHKGEIEPA